MMEVASLIGSAVSVILGGFALLLSVVFFINTKGTETKVSNALEGIKAQTNVLQNITLRHLGKFIKHATDNNNPILPAIPSTAHITDITEAFANQLAIRKAETDSAIFEKEEATAGYITACIGLNYYCAITNVVAQGQLSQIEQNETNSPLITILKDIANSSYSDFNGVQVILKDKVHPTRVKASPLFALYNTTESIWAPLVKDATQFYTEKESGQ